ncbi:MAG: carboxypeptidase, partial [Propionibacteriales bacterium]|nr:carboxypeptidase [Propionibacteriales bacterium]
MRALILAAATAVTVPLLSPALTSIPAQAADCDPFTTSPEYAGRVPTGEDVLGFPLGSQEVTSAESDTYVEAVDAASERVSTGVLATSHQGRPLTYAIVGSRRDVARAQHAARVLRDPETSAKKAAKVAADSPAVAWVAGNVHGNEESGTDAALRLLHDLADRTDCAAGQIRDNTVVVIQPTQNPDGREADTRRNVYGFDLNRDWFARTQPETDGKLELLRDLPPVLFVDDHEMGADGFFFPPNADPVYHDIPDRSIDWINDLYGAAMAAEFDRREIPFFNYD